MTMMLAPPRRGQPPRLADADGARRRRAGSSRRPRAAAAALADESARRGLVRAAGRADAPPQSRRTPPGRCGGAHTAGLSARQPDAPAAPKEGAARRPLRRDPAKQSGTSHPPDHQGLRARRRLDRGDLDDSASVQPPATGAEPSGRSASRGERHGPLAGQNEAAEEARARQLARLATCARRASTKLQRRRALGVTGEAQPAAQLPPGHRASAGR